MILGGGGSPERRKASRCGTRKPQRGAQGRGGPLPGEVPDLEIQDKGRAAWGWPRPSWTRGCDLYLTADYQNIEDILKPAHATWNLLLHQRHGGGLQPQPRAAEISAANWFRFWPSPMWRGANDPNKDPGVSGPHGLAAPRPSTVSRGWKIPGILGTPGGGWDQRQGVKRLMGGALGYIWAPLLRRGGWHADGGAPGGDQPGRPCLAENYARASVEIKARETTRSP